MSRLEDSPYCQGRCFTWHIHLSVKQIRLLYKLVLEASETDKEIAEELKGDVQDLYNGTVGRFGHERSNF